VSDSTRTVELVAFQYAATYTNGAWAGANAPCFARLMQLDKLPWPIRMTVRHEGPGSFKIGDNALDRDYVPPMHPFKCVPAEGTHCTGEFLVPAEAITFPRSSPATELPVNELEDALDEAIAKTASLFENLRFPE